MNPVVALALAVLILASMLPYVRRAKHPEARPLAAYLVFVTVFAVVAGALYVALGALIARADLSAALENPWGAALFLAAIFVPALLVARWQIRRAPVRRPPPP